MKPASGGLVRFLLEAGFLVLVAAVAAVAHLGAVAIILVMFLAWLLTAVVERVASRRGAARVAAPGVSELSPEELIVRVEPPEPRPRGRFWQRRELEPGEPAAEAHAEEEEAEEPAMEPEPPVLTAVPLPPPEPEAEEMPLEEPPAPELPEPVVLPVRAEPREWNVWELERRARGLAGEDAARSEELSYLLMHLRGFASPDGMLPVDFDVLVRESFAELVEPAQLR